MNCRDVQSSRAAHDAGSLSPGEAAAWVEHVHRCERCSEGLRDFEALLGELPEEPFDLEENIMQEVRKRSATAKRTPWYALFLRPAFGAGVCAGLVMLFLLSSFLRGPAVQVARDEGTPTAARSSLILADSRLVLRGGAVEVDGKRVEADDPGAASIALHDGDRVVTDETTRGALELGAAVLALRPRLDFTVHPDRLALRRGKTYVHLRRQGREFKVTTPLLICAVRGTTFSVAHDDEAGSVVSLAESAGRVTVSLGTGDDGDGSHPYRIDLADGESLGVTTEGETSTTPMTEGELRETVTGAAEALGQPVQQLASKILQVLDRAGKTTGTIIDFFQGMASVPTAPVETPREGGSSSGSSGGSADMWRSR